MSHKEQLKSIATGVLSAGLFLIIYGFDIGIPLMMLPSLPLLMLGLSRPAVSLFIACAAAGSLVLLATGPESALFYTAFIAIPTLLFAPAAIAHRHGHLRPVGEILTDLAIYAALVYAAAIAYFAAHGGLQQQIVAYVREGFADADPQLQETVQSLGGTLAFLILAASAWWWVLLLYAHAIIANGLLSLQARKARASLTLTAFSPPSWLLGALTATGIVSLCGFADWAFMAQAILLIILLPYFLLGLALMQEKIRFWPGRGILLFMLYFLTLSLVWPALIIAAAGVWKQCRALIHPMRHS